MSRIFVVLFAFFAVQSFNSVNGSHGLCLLEKDVLDNNGSPGIGSVSGLTPEEALEMASKDPHLKEILEPILREKNSKGCMIGIPFSRFPGNIDNDIRLSESADTVKQLVISESGQVWGKLWSLDANESPVINLIPRRKKLVNSIVISWYEGERFDAQENKQKVKAVVTIREKSEAVENSLKEKSLEYTDFNYSYISCYYYEIGPSSLSDMKVFLSVFVGCGYFGEDIADFATKRLM